MSEVKYYWAGCPEFEGPTEKVVLAKNFDRVTAERDAALAENKLLRNDVGSYLETVAKVCDMLGVDLESAKSAEGKPSDVLFSYVSSMQQRLTAADERADVLEGLVRDSKDVMSGIWDTSYDHEAGDALAALDLMERIDSALKPAEGGGDEWKSWTVGNTVRYQGSGQDGEDCYCRMRKGSDYLIHEAPDDHESMVVLDDDGDELCVLVGEFKWIKP